MKAARARHETINNNNQNIPIVIATISWTDIGGLTIFRLSFFFFWCVRGARVYEKKNVNFLFRHESKTPCAGSKVMFRIQFAYKMVMNGYETEKNIKWKMKQWNLSAHEYDRHSLQHTFNSVNELKV